MNTPEGQPRPLRALLVDPSLFTGPYDAALTEGLLAAGVEPMWATRPTRQGDRQEIPPQYTDPFFYKHVDDATALPRPLRALAKGVAHAWGMARLVHRVWRNKPDVVHVQWVVLPPLDVLALWLIRLRTKLVLTVHDTVPFNGERMSLLQNLGFDLPIRLADGVIVHTQSGRSRLVARGLVRDNVRVIPHGPLPLHASPSQPRPPRDSRWTFVLFGELKPYKGLDLLIEALGQLPKELLAQCRLIVGGRPRMDLAAIQVRIERLDLLSVVDMRPHRHSEQEMADLFDEADTFIFPYRQIDASGVYFLVKSFRKWTIASRVGVFSEDIVESLEGQLLPPGNVVALKDAMQYAITARPQPKANSSRAAWGGIGLATRQLYLDAGSTLRWKP